ncbi:hypothetical protein EI94DRAFT_1704756 [Lactarius quietus]|nr:hypothetical protein EI94DRAFT_1704756 [Lactarius quietus]
MGTINGFGTTAGTGTTGTGTGTGHAQLWHVRQKRIMALALAPLWARISVFGTAVGTGTMGTGHHWHFDNPRHGSACRVQRPFKLQASSSSPALHEKSQLFALRTQGTSAPGVDARRIVPPRDNRYPNLSPEARVTPRVSASSSRSAYSGIIMIDGALHMMYAMHAVARLGAKRRMVQYHQRRCGVLAALESIDPQQATDWPIDLTN